ncbi:hypothetical protein CIPAW_05G218000 [Carya illinoinensis]|uniref:Uncharacterized protein n=1 Tax=Carya illinoinensis TaxID=32201 RepID=A0A8T1QME8_CARIL|nr:hypothetical protein CIPAW_05G218000 [Carya illinoinensis]
MMGFAENLPFCLSRFMQLLLPRICPRSYLSRKKYGSYLGDTENLQSTKPRDAESVEMMVPRGMGVSMKSQEYWMEA